MSTFVQLSDQTYLNLDTVRTITVEVGGDDIQALRVRVTYHLPPRDNQASASPFASSETVNIFTGDEAHALLTWLSSSKNVALKYKPSTVSTAPSLYK